MWLYSKGASWRDLRDGGSIWRTSQERRTAAQSTHTLLLPEIRRKVKQAQGDGQRPRWGREWCQRGRKRHQNCFSRQNVRSPGRILLTVELAGILDGAALDLFDDQLGDCHAGAEHEQRRPWIDHLLGSLSKARPCWGDNCTVASLGVAVQRPPQHRRARHGLASHAVEKGDRYHRRARCFAGRRLIMATEPVPFFNGPLTKPAEQRERIHSLDHAPAGCGRSGWRGPRRPRSGRTSSGRQAGRHHLSPLPLGEGKGEGCCHRD